jgi:hypothetical protein
MRFLNQKEEILDFQLTSYGKYLLSRGGIKPCYYAFLDDSMVYDSNCSFVSESLSDPDIRIRENSPQFQAQTTTDGIQTNFLRNSETRAQKTYDKMFSSMKSLGNSSIGNSNFPAFSVNFYKTAIDDAQAYLSGSYANVQIPQIFSKLEYTVKIESSSSQKYDFSTLKSRLFEDGTFLNIEEDVVLASIGENNTNSLSENFEIEVFKVESWGGFGTSPAGTAIQKENLIPLSFAKRKKQILTENLELKEESDAEDEELQLTPSNVEYYFDIFVDSEIDSSELCAIQDKDQNFYVQGFGESDCPSKTESKDIYSSLSDDVFEEPC